MNTSLPKDSTFSSYMLPQIPISSNRMRTKPQKEPNSRTISLTRKATSENALKVLIKSVVVTTIPVNMKKQMTYIPLISATDLKVLSPLVTSFVQLSPEYKNILSNQHRIGLNFVSEISRTSLHPFKEEFDLFLIGIKDGRYYVTYGRISNNNLVYN